MKSFKFKNDKFKKRRNNWSRLLNLHCRKCNDFVAIYQKDGSGILRRLYFDRILAPENLVKLNLEKIKDMPSLKCKKCKEILGTPYIYEKENRKAFRLYVDAIIKKTRRLKK